MDHEIARARTARRRFLRTVMLGVAAVMVLPARAQLRKMTLKEAEYQDEPKDIRMCATCALFLPPEACKIVDGKVKPTGWCKAFEMMD